MTTKPEDRSRDTKKLSMDEQKVWDLLIFKLGFTDPWNSDDFDHQNTLRYTWSNK